MGEPTVVYDKTIPENSSTIRNIPAGRSILHRSIKLKATVNRNGVTNKKVLNTLAHEVLHMTCLLSIPYRGF